MKVGTDVFISQLLVVNLFVVGMKITSELGDGNGEAVRVLSRVKVTRVTRIVGVFPHSCICLSDKWKNKEADKGTNIATPTSFQEDQKNSLCTGYHRINVNVN